MARAHSISLTRTWEASAQQLPRSTQPLSQAHPLASGRGGALHSSLPQITASRASGSYGGSMKSAALLPPSQSSGEHLSVHSAKISHSFAHHASLSTQGALAGDAREAVALADPASALTGASHAGLLRSLLPRSPATIATALTLPAAVLVPSLQRKAPASSGLGTRRAPHK
eukprot:scaffold2879_cov269-Prasinococcus_capsulatus_cf.AAC.34